MSTSPPDADRPDPVMLLSDVLHRLAEMHAGDHFGDSYFTAETVEWLLAAPIRVQTLLSVVNVLIVEAGLDPSTLSRWATTADEVSWAADL